MAALIEKLPITLTVDAFISFLRYIFANENLTPQNYRYVEDTDNTNGTRKTNIKISTKFPINDEKNMSTPNIQVIRSAYQKNNRINENIASGTENTFSTFKRMLIYDGIISVVINCNHASEASNLANFIILMVEENKRNIIDATRFIRFLDSTTISEEIEAKLSPEVSRWTVIANFMVSIYLGVWKREIQGSDIINKISVRAITEKETVYGTKGSIIEEENTMIDVTKNFGTSEDSDPFFDQKELDNGWYYLKFEDDIYYYVITKIVDENTLELSMIGDSGSLIPFESSKTEVDLKYEILWNSNHIYVNVPKIQ